MSDDLISKMRARITFQSESGSSDGAGGTSISWANGSTVWAYFRPLTSRSVTSERFRYGKLENSITHIVTIRYISGITEKMRISYDSRTFNIRRVVNLDERNEFLEILVQEGLGE